MASRLFMRFVQMSATLGFGLMQAVSIAQAKEIHMDCARASQSVAVDVDTARLFVQLMWSEGVAEEYLNGDSYISGPFSSGEKDKVTYAVSADDEAITFGQDRVCIEKGAREKCTEQHSRNTLDTAAGVLKYDDGGPLIAILQCVPAPPGRRF
ncbi:MAG: hypothetical protein HYS06_08460 [Methylocystis sp.]|nr:hypothetical protein [Methylocystis sp.]